MNRTVLSRRVLRASAARALALLLPGLALFPATAAAAGPEWRSEGPFGGTVAHGFLTLSLLTAMMGELLDIGGVTHFVNYGLDRVRFTGVVRAGDRVRLQQTAAVTPVEGGVRLTMKCTMQIEDRSSPSSPTSFSSRSPDRRKERTMPTVIRLIVAGRNAPYCTPAQLARKAFGRS
jgi:hypothetical protein